MYRYMYELHVVPTVPFSLVDGPKRSRANFLFNYNVLIGNLPFVSTVSMHSL